MPRDNGLNLIRLALAQTVVVGHCWVISGAGAGPAVGSVPTGALAVYCFFALSGYLITKSAQRTTTATYAWHRVLRIFPGLAAMAVITAFVLAPLAALVGDHSYSLSAATGWVVRRVVLVLPDDGQIGSTLLGRPDAVWNGSTWTLLYEVACYAVVAGFAVSGLLRRRWSVALAYAGLEVLALAHGLVGGSLHVGALYCGLLLGFLIPFLAGSLLAVYDDVVPRDSRVALLCAVAVVGAFALSSDPLTLASLPIAYLLLWVGGTVRPGSVIRDNDLSYGAYIWGYPLGQVLALRLLPHAGPLALAAVVVPAVLVVAALSWHLVEQPALRMKDRALPNRRLRTVA